MGELTAALREASRSCSGQEPSLSLLQLTAEVGADILDSPNEAMLQAGKQAVYDYTGLPDSEPQICCAMGLSYLVWKAMLGAAPAPLDGLGEDQAATAPAIEIVREVPPSWVMPSWVILPDHSLAIRFSLDPGAPAFMNFQVFSAGSIGAVDGSDGEQWELDPEGSRVGLDQWEDAFCEIDGFLKWDGCINWKTNPDCMMHGCGPSHVDAISAFFAAVYHVGKRHMNLLGDAVPDMPEGAIEVAG